MPLKLSARERKAQPPEVQEDIEQRAIQPKLEPDEAEPMEPGRPYQAFVESRLRQYLRDNYIRSMVKPTQEEIRAAAMPILCKALRNRPGRKLYPYLNMAHHAVADVVEHVRDAHWTRTPLSDPFASPTYVDALIQLAHDADWLAPELLLPDHPGPRHPPVYYRIDIDSKMPVPTEESLIRGDYVYTRSGQRITKAAFIYPWQEPGRFPTERDFITLGWDTCYRLGMTSKKIEIFIHGISKIESRSTPWVVPLNLLHFAPNPNPSIGL